MAQVSTDGTTVKSTPEVGKGERKMGWAL